ncbi:DUF2397 domain-containing protein [Haloactinomyces albus]|uniref:Uncharacterized protein (TIGR02677 family) n=1 Tax=Haloactinomyces albus TaxID=1352928 RepID=A0AAE3ZBU1_9ACTN|nr:DUF2397 domain-containing protein [Haloactinomyces albus]MDR7300833.1 uncharacterized protein (TIGR02677 family) [Haloactinomyces albus]
MTVPEHDADVLPPAERDTAERDMAQEGTRAEQRLQLFAYLQAPEHHTYLAIMRLFTSTLLADLSADEVAAALVGAERDGRIDAGESEIGTVIDRLRRLVKWGNLVVGRRETIASSIAEFQHGSVRYQVSKLAVRVQRDVDTLLHVPEGAREVSRELLPAIERGVTEISALLSEALSAEQHDPAAKPAGQAGERLAEQVTTVFLQHAELAATVRDFYAYLGQVVTRHHLAPEEISGFRNLLVEYIQMVVEDVLRHTRTIAAALSGITSRREELLRVLGPAEDLGAEVERARGRTEADWQELTDWFVDSPGRPSQVSSLREATARAIGSLLASVRRATSDGGLMPGRRGDLLKLARWFDEAEPDRAHQLYAATFGLHSARHLQPAPDYDSDNHEVAWRDGPVLDVPVNVRSRGDRGARGRASRVLHDPMTEEALLSEARAEKRRRRAAAAELTAAAAHPTEIRLSTDALGVLCELLTKAQAQREHPDDTGWARDPVHRLQVTIRHTEGHETRIGSSSGTLTLRNTALELRGDDTPAEAGTGTTANSTVSGGSR